MHKITPDRIMPKSFVPQRDWPVFGRAGGRGHPFRRKIAPQVLAIPVPTKRAHDDDHDWKLFVLSFAAFFITIYSFIF